MLAEHPPGRMSRRRVVAALGICLAVALPLGNTAHAATKKKTTKKTTTTKPKKSTNALPAVSVTDVSTGKPYALQTAVTGKLPTLVWFWAPH